jgi:nicotinamidase-related amidase
LASYLLLWASIGGFMMGAAGEVLGDEPFQLTKTRQLKGTAGDWERTEESVRWDPRKTAIIVCDVWDYHHCLNAVRRLDQFAPRLDGLLTAARERGAVIIHAPSDCMEAYAEHPARRRAMEVSKAADLPKEIVHWCSKIPSEEEAVYPIDQSDGGEDDDPAEHAQWSAKLASLGRNPALPWKMQSPSIRIDGQSDYLSDKGDEVWNVLRARGIEHVMLTGVHVNMCVLGRPFGLRQLSSHGFDVVLVRDLTDAMYNPKRWPYVDHHKGTQLVIEHIERYVCPTITSDMVLGGEPFEFHSLPGAEVSQAAEAVVEGAPDRLVNRLVPATNQWLVRQWPSSWEAMGAETSYRRTAWYRRALRLPDRSESPSLRLTVRTQPQVRVECWWEGTSLMMDSEAAGTWSALIPEGVRVDGDANLLVLKLDGKQQQWPTAIEVALSIGAMHRSLHGPWQVRLGEDASWTQMPLPAKFGASTDIVVDLR